MRDFQLWGGKIVIRKFDTPRDLAALREPIVINCTGLGARDLFGDQELIPLKGQLTVLLPQPEVNYHTNGGVPPVPGASLGIHMMARNDGIILGGTSQRGVWTLDPDEAERKRVVDAHIAVFSAMKGVRTLALRTRHPAPRAGGLGIAVARSNLVRAALAFFAFLAIAVPIDGPAGLKVMTFNIQHGIDGSLSYNLQRAIDAIAKIQPDLVALQEVPQNHPYLRLRRSACADCRRPEDGDGA